MSDKAVTIDTYHDEIHNGWLFSVPYKIAALAAGAAHVISLQTPPSTQRGPLHFKPIRLAAAANIVECRMAEGSTTSGGATQTPLNRNRASTFQSAAIVKGGATLSAEGATIIDYSVAGTGGRSANSRGSGSAAGSNDEIMLLPDTVYSIRVQNIGQTTATDVYMELVWYENTVQDGRG